MEEIAKWRRKRREKWMKKSKRVNGIAMKKENCLQQRKGKQGTG